MDIQAQSSASGNAPLSAKEMLEYDRETWLDLGELRRRVIRAEQADDTIHQLSLILGDHLGYQSHKLADNVVTFNMNSAHDCDNRQTERCQVGDGECYAVQTENFRPHTLASRRRQEALWDMLDPATWAKAFRAHVSRHRTKDIDTIRFSQSGDFRSRRDILKVNEIARRLDDIVDVYTYSASSHLDWSEATHFTVNQSNDIREYGDRRFAAVPSEEQIPEDAIHCPFDATDGDIECGECRLCLNGDAGDVYVTIH